MATLILFAACNVTDPYQLFSLNADSTISAPAFPGSCVAFSGSPGGSPLYLAPCNASVPTQAWVYNTTTTSILNPTGSCAGPGGACLSWSGMEFGACASTPPALGVGCALSAWPTKEGPTPWNNALLANSPAESMLQALYAHPAGPSPSGLCAAAAPPPPPPVPTADILAWTEREIGMFLCFDMISVLISVPNAQHFCLGVGGDMGFPLPPPSAYAPAALDTDSWLAAAVALGAKYTIFVAQHCSGFSQWPSDILAATGFNYTYSTAFSPGAPNVVESYVASSKRAGIATGLYYSLNENYYLNVGHGRVGFAPLAPGQVNVSQELYNRVAVAQMTELWSRYPGEFSELWFDGGDDLPGVNDAIARFQPQAVYLGGSMKQNNLRWVGTESGHPRGPVWSTTDEAAGGQPAAGAGNPQGALFSPAETDTTLSREDAWFWKPGYSYRSLPDLQQAYHDSVGANSNLLLNLAVGADGGVPAPAQALYQALGDWVRRCYGRAAASVAPPPGSVVTLELPGSGVAIDRVVAMEDQSAGEQVLAYSVSVRVPGGGWLPAGEGSAIGHKRIHFFPAPVPLATAVRLNVTAARGASPVAWRALAAIDGVAQCL